LASTLTGTRLSACPRLLTMVFFKISEIELFFKLFYEANLEVRNEARYIEGDLGG
jgi:hypothetical protein